jgi:phosphatidylserine/phosphatidylglycerophosphate/cardiolipin synthase-like enzyme
MGPAWAAGKKTASADETGACPVTMLENKDFFPALLGAIDKAQHEIFISIFSFKAGVHPNSYPDQILAGLERAVKRGVQVNVILEVTSDHTNDLTRQNMKTKTLLEEKGVTVYLDSPKKTTHTKLVLVDGRSVFLGSHNFTSSALKHNNEISVLIEQPQLARKVRTYMLKIIKEAK